MNHPERDVIGEIEWMSDMGLGFIDLTLEPPCAATWVINAPAIKSAIQDAGFAVVGHTAYYLPIGSPFESLRLAAVDELKGCLNVFAEIGAKWMNVHPDRYAPMHPRSFYIKKDIESLRELIDFGRSCGVGVMVENLPHDFNDAAQLGELLDPIPELGLHLDYGHSNLEVPKNTAGQILDKYGTRLQHVHMHDNRGGNQDLHLPLGTGNIDYYDEVKALKKCGYDGTITLEVFSPDRHYLEYSRDVLQSIWDVV